MSDTLIRTLIIAGTATACALTLAPQTATADNHHARCDRVSGELEEDFTTGAACPPDHPNCFTGHIDGHNIHATTRFYGEGSAPAPAPSPGWFSYSGVTTYTMHHGSIVTRETGVTNSDDIPEGGGRASLSLEVITEGTGDLAGATGYLFVTGFVDADRHVTSHVEGKICAN